MMRMGIMMEIPKVSFDAGKRPPKDEIMNEIMNAMRNGEVGVIGAQNLLILCS